MAHASQLGDRRIRPNLSYSPVKNLLAIFFTLPVTGRKSEAPQIEPKAGGYRGEGCRRVKVND